MVWPREYLSCSCLSDLEHLVILCHLYYLLQEMPPWVSPLLFTFHYRRTRILHNQTNDHCAKHPDVALIVAGDFNKANLRLQVMPNLFQHITNTGENILHHYYTHYSRMTTKPFLSQLLVQLIMLLSSSGQNTNRCSDRRLWLPGRSDTGRPNQRPNCSIPWVMWTGIC